MTKKLLAILLLFSLALHLYLANIKQAIPPLKGEQINPPSHWNQDNPTRFRVSTYNIRRGKGDDGIRDIRRTATNLLNADIIALNEVAGAWDGSNQAQQLGKILDMGWLFAPTQRRWYRDYYGNGFLSRFPVKTWTIRPLLYANNGRHRNLVTTQLQISEHSVYSLTTHLDISSVREDQLSYVIDQFLHYKSAILMGDLNTNSDNLQLIQLFDSGDAKDAIKLALGESAPKKRKDWIITRGFKVIKGGFMERGISDHPCFWVELETL